MGFDVSIEPSLNGNPLLLYIKKILNTSPLKVMKIKGFNSPNRGKTNYREDDMSKSNISVILLSLSLIHVGRMNVHVVLQSITYYCF